MVKTIYKIIKKLRDEDWFIAKYGKQKPLFVDGWDACLDSLMEEIEKNGAAK